MPPSVNSSSLRNAKPDIPHLEGLCGVRGRDPASASGRHSPRSARFDAPHLTDDTGDCFNLRHAVAATTKNKMPTSARSPTSQEHAQSARSQTSVWLARNSPRGNSADNTQNLSEKMSPRLHQHLNGAPSPRGVRLDKEFMDQDMRQLIREELRLVFQDSFMPPPDLDGVVGGWSKAEAPVRQPEEELASAQEDQPAVPQYRSTRDDREVAVKYIKANHLELAVTKARKAQEIEHAPPMAAASPAEETLVERCNLWLDSIGIGTDRPPPRNDFISRVADSAKFQKFMAIVIVLNCVQMGFEVSALISSPNEVPGLDPFDACFLAAYTIELFINIWRQRCLFFYGEGFLLNWLDTFLVIIGMLSLLLVEGSFAGLRSLKMIRLAKMAKGVRVLRVMTMFKKLQSVLSSIFATMETLFACFVLITLLLYMCSLTTVSGVAGCLEEDNLSKEQRRDLLEYYGSVGHAFISLLEATTDSWGVYYRALQPVGWVYQAAFILLVLFVDIAVLNIVLGMFMDAVMKHLQGNKEVVWQELAANEKNILKDIKEFLMEKDAGQDGKMTSTNWSQIVTDGKLLNYLHSLGLRPRDADRLFHQCAEISLDSQVDIQHFVNACMTLKGQASRFEVHELHLAIRELAHDLEAALGMTAAQAQRVERLVQDGLNTDEVGEQTRTALQTQSYSKHVLQGASSVEREMRGHVKTLRGAVKQGISKLPRVDAGGDAC